jgi:hypothetical protein
VSEKLSKAQFRVLLTCHEVGGLFRYRSSLWNWYRKHPQGAISRVSGNVTIEVLKGKGMLSDAGFDTVAVTPAGRAHLASHVGRPKVQP